MYMLAGANLGKGLELGHSAGLSIHHGEEGGLCLSVDELLLGTPVIDTNKASEFNHLLFLKISLSIISLFFFVIRTLKFPSIYMINTGTMDWI